MAKPRVVPIGILVVIGSMCVASAAAATNISLTTLGSAYTQNFDSLASTGTSSATPPGWVFSETGSGANTLYSAGTGSSSTVDTYSFGNQGSSERAFGGLRSGTLNPIIGVGFRNDTGSTITSLAIEYIGEQWRLGQNTAGRPSDRLDFQYSIDATSVTTGTWTDVNALDFLSPTISGAVGALDGNAGLNRGTLSFAPSGLNIAAGADFWLRWVDSDLTPGADDGLAVDDFSLTAVPEPSTLALVSAGLLGLAVRRRMNA